MDAITCERCQDEKSATNKSKLTHSHSVREYSVAARETATFGKAAKCNQDAARCSTGYMHCCKEKGWHHMTFEDSACQWK